MVGCACTGVGAYIHMHVHTHVKHDKHGCLHGGSHLHFLTCSFSVTLMHLCVHMCMDTPTPYPHLQWSTSKSVKSQ